MGEALNRSSTSRLGLLRGSGGGGGGGGGGGEIIEVQGGHIVRSTGRKDRHSKVCTAKGPRDRRVRLSAHTAIQFYDVQDRLGYDRPSKAVDWLINKAKSAIDELAELPPWHPTATMPSRPNTSNPEHHQMEEDEEENQNEQGFLGGVEQTAGRYMFLQNQQDESNSFLPPSLDSDSIADTIKSFFPMAATSSSSIHFQNYSSPPDLLSRTNSQTQDLRLSLQSFQDPIFHHHHHSQQHHHSNPSSEQQHALFSTAFDTGGGGGGGSTNAWSEQQMQEMGRFQRMIAWNPNTDSSGGGNGNGSGSGGGGGFMFNSPPQQQPQPPSSQQAVQQQTLFSNSPNPFFSPQRGPLQSSNSPLSIRAWNNTTDPSMVSDDNQQYQNLNSSIHHHHQQQPFASGGFGFRIPARIQGEEEHDHVGASHKPPSSAPRH